MNNKTNEMLIGGAVVFKEIRSGKFQFLLNKNEEDEWEIIKAIARKGESSVRAAIRYTTEQGSMNARVIEEASRATGFTTVNGKSVVQKYLYYVMVFKTGGEMIGFDKVAWFDYPTAIRKLKLKREQDALRSANKIIKVWKKEQKELEKSLQPS